MNFKKLIVEEFNSPESKSYMALNYKRIAKSVELTKQIREAGTEMFIECQHDATIHEKIWDSYSCSITLAPNNSETLAISFGNMSAILYHLCKYEDCIKNIDRALSITKSIFLKIKFLCRKAKCLAHLGKPDKDTVFEEATFWLNKIDDKDKYKKELQCSVNKAKNILNKKITISVKKESSIEKKENKLPDNIIFSESHLNDFENKKKKKRRKKKKNENMQKNHIEILVEKEKENIFDSVAVKMDDYHGRHLVATRDIRPGEIIFVAKPYLLVPNFTRSQNFCNNCLRVVWAGIPCNNCACCIYCSEECQKEAQKKYHDIECTTLQFAINNDAFDYHIHASMKAVIMAVKEFETISNLREEIINIDNCTNIIGNDVGFSKDRKFRHDSFISLFSFKNIFVDSDTLNQLTKSCCRAVISLARFSSFFGNNYKFKTIKDLITNDDVVFIAILLLRIAIIIYNNGIKVTELGMPCKNELDPSICLSSLPCCDWGFSLNTLNSFIPHSCNPNVKSIKIEGGKDLWYAVQPIYKGEPLYECYNYTFYELELSHRSEITAQILKRNCSCIACTENWPAVLISNEQMLNYDDAFRIVVESREYEHEKIKFLDLVSKYGLSDQKIVNELSDILEASYDYFGQPSIEVCAAICILHHTFNQLYGIKLKISDQCRTPLP